MTVIRSHNRLPADTAKWDATRLESALRYADKQRQPVVEQRREGRRVTVRRTPVKPVSDKRARENRQRAAMLREMFPEPENVMCAVPGCCRRADDAHEPLTRARGGSITDPDNTVPLCRPHHNEITDTEPQWAYELGLLKHSWDVA